MNMRLGLIVAFATLATLVPAKQMTSTKPPAEMNKLSWMLGTWKGPMTYQEPGGKPMQMEGVVKNVMTLGGRYLQGMHKMSGKGSPTTEGLLLVNYDPAKKAFVSYWVDSSGPGMMESTGPVTDDSLVLTGSFEMPGGNKINMRVSYIHKGNSCLMKLEMQQNGKWVESMSGVYKKS